VPSLVFILQIRKDHRIAIRRTVHYNGDILASSVDVL